MSDTDPHELAPESAPESEKTNPGGDISLDPVARELRRLGRKVDNLRSIIQATYNEVCAVKPRVDRHDDELEDLRSRVRVLERIARISRESDT